jgi:hypothetical protein
MINHKKGGVNVMAFVGGGVLPAAAQGQVLDEGLFHIADWSVRLVALNHTVLRQRRVHC